MHFLSFYLFLVPALKGFNALLLYLLNYDPMLSYVASLCSTYSADRTKTSIRLLR